MNSFNQIILEFMEIRQRLYLKYISIIMLTIGTVFIFLVSFKKNEPIISYNNNPITTTENLSKDIGSTINDIQKESNVSSIAKEVSSNLESKLSPKFGMATAIGIGLLVAFASLVFGGFLGFIFAIPKIKYNNNNSNSNQVIQNDNLEEISDWLTKIIVGVSLTQLKEFPELMDKLGKYLAPAFTNSRLEGATTNASEIIGVSITLYYVILGFMILYLWTRIEYKSVLSRTIEMDDIIKK